MKYHFWLRLRDICREGDGDGTGDGTGGDGTGDGAGTTDPNKKTFTQEDVNALLAKERRAAQARAQETLKQLEAIKQEGLTPEAKAALEAQMEALRAQSQTEAELAKQQLNKLKREAAAREKALEAERDQARAAFEKLQVDTLLSNAMGLHGVKPNAVPVLGAFLQQRMQKVPVLGDDGKATGDYRYMINIEEPDGDEGKTKTLQLTPEKAVAHLRESEAFAGLYATTARSGIGGQNAGASGEPDISKMTQQQYMEWRKQRQKTS